ncbi:uncharacterized protein LOC103520762 [Diaphorina citri]|uniref:Uncharacterized protein LOC103520762 n=1 Tax=Diaphorina citri TaxID=121845 RepID=A0A3Q0JK55_DIACI|nr:uncharacterized protein LOC103520762 [Diaphorina citri]
MDCVLVIFRCDLVKIGSGHTSGDEQDTNTTSSSIEIISRCDLVKIGSGHTSGDEQDTNTTSSSIEIISSPNGDGSSSTTASRQSPAKLLTSSRPRRAAPGSRPHIPELMGDSAPPDVRGHERVPSESWSEDTEADKLHKSNKQTLEEAQHRNEELSESMISATKPLAQQIESLSSSHALASEAWEEQERRLNQTINELQSRLSSVKDIERHSKEQTISMSSKISALESKLESEHRDVIRLREQLQTLNEDIEKLNSEKESILRVKEAQITSLTHEAAECRRCCIGLEQQLSHP